MDLGLAGKTALVTGSTKGIGFAAALALGREGARVVVNGRTGVEEAAVRLRAEGVRGVVGVAADLGTAAGCERLIAGAGEVDILVNNVGVFEPVPFERITDEQWARVWEVNVMSGVRLSRHYVGRMKARGWGRIVFVSSESGLQIPAEMVHYGVSKTAQIALARGLAETCAGTGVTVNSVLPGPTASEGVAEFVGKLADQSGQTAREFEAEFFRTARPTSLLKRFLTPEEVASMIAYVCSEKAAGTNGAAMRVDGGVVRAIG